jgi:transcriptional regulator GlxA family with amidase domain
VHAQVVLYEGFDPLDVIGPFEVLHAGGAASGGALTVELVSADGPGRVASGTPGIALQANAALDPGRAGVVVVPGVVGPIAGDPETVDTIPVLLARVGSTALPAVIAKAMGNPEVLVAAVCGGTLALAMAGLIEGRAAVTHVRGMDVLEATGVRAIDARIVDDGDFVSAGGVTSGLDLGLYLLERTVGPRVAREVELLFQYERRGVVWREAGLEPVAY